MSKPERNVPECLVRCLEIFTPIQSVGQRNVVSATRAISWNVQPVALASRRGRTKDLVFATGFISGMLIRIDMNYLSQTR
jgi:hypothetical protein